MLFSSDNELYGLLGRYLTGLAESGGIGRRLAEQDKAISFATSEPSARITMSWVGEAPVVTMGTSPVVPDLEVAGTADDLHSLFLGARTPWELMSSGELRTSGDGALAPLTWDAISFAGPSRYRALLIQADRKDLINEDRADTE